MRRITMTSSCRGSRRPGSGSAGMMRIWHGLRVSSPTSGAAGAGTPHPAGTAIVSDAITAVGRFGEIGIAFGCEAAKMHQEGGNFVFLDGHSHRIARNAERYLKRRSDGTWFEQYFTYDME